MSGEIIIRGARLHNLKNITVQIPKNKLIAITGLSGSGKSALAFDILNREGQRQYMESMGWVAYKMGRPPVDKIEGLAPTISVDQQNLTNRSPRSTVGTETDIYTYLRVLFARVGHRPCPACGKEIAPPLGEAEPVLYEAGESDQPSTYPCPHCTAQVEELSMAHFSFNTPHGACPTCTGLGVVNQVDVGQLLDEAKSLREGAVAGWGEGYLNYQVDILHKASQHYGLPFDPHLPVGAYGQAQRDLLLHGVESPQFRRHFPGVEPPATAKGRALRGGGHGLYATLRRAHRRPEVPGEDGAAHPQPALPRLRRGAAAGGEPGGDRGGPQHRRAGADAAGRPRPLGGCAA
jgi:excinuclease ABC subunit A